MEPLLLAILIVGATVAFAVAGTAIARRLPGHAASHNEVAIALFAGASVTYAVLLGFMVVVVWEAYDNAHRNLAEEAASIVSIYRLTYGMEAPEGAKLRRLVRRYTDAVIHDEWPKMGSNEAGDSKARKAIGDIDRVFATMDPAAKAADAQVDSEFLGIKTVIVRDRNMRLFEASDSIPWIIWLGALGGAFIVIVMSCFITMERAAPHMLMSGLMASMIGLLLFVVVVLSQPFTGMMRLSTRHFQNALMVMDDVDHGD